MCILLIDHFMNHTEMNGINVVGLLACLVGIIIHVYIKASKGKNGLVISMHRIALHAP